MSTFVVVLVLATATLHALWNFATRKSEGNIVAVWLSLAFTGLVTLPAAIATAIQEYITATALLYILATGVVHAAYFTLLAKAYRGGDISLVYPIARGTGVAGTAVVILFLAIEGVQPQAGGGIAAVCAGILLIGLGQMSRRNCTVSKTSAFGLALLVGVTIIGYNVVDKLAVSNGPAGAARTGGLHPLVYICAMFLGAALFMTPYVVMSGRGRIADCWRTQKKYIAVIGPAALCTYLPILFAYRWEKATSIVAFREFSVVIGSVLGFLFLRERLTAPKAAGILLVATGLVLIKSA